MKALIAVLLLVTIPAYAVDWENQAFGFTNTDLPGYDPETNPNRTGIVSVSLDLNTAHFWLGDPGHNPVIPHNVYIGSENHYCWPLADGTWRRRDMNYVNASYVVDVILDSDNVLYVYLDDVLLVLPEYDGPGSQSPFCVETQQ
jgi:hypothetical protein